MAGTSKETDATAMPRAYVWSGVILLILRTHKTKSTQKVNTIQQEENDYSYSLRYLRVSIPRSPLGSVPGKGERVPEANGSKGRWRDAVFDCYNRQDSRR
jgi:hypothetical protein